MAEDVRKRFEVVVVGAGPAGLAAAASAAENGAQVAILDNNPDLGGQIWRGESARSGSDAAKWAAKLKANGVEILCGVNVVHHQRKSQVIFAESDENSLEVGFSKLILATGARERFLPFPGWTLPNVMAAGIKNIRAAPPHWQF